MNNKKILVVGVLAVIVTMMVGYALFSETITINGTATAKGDFALTATCQAGLNIGDVLNNMLVETFGNDNGYFNDTCSVNGNAVTMNTNLKYPGAQRFFTVSVKNTGSIDAVLNVDDPSVLNSTETIKVYNSKTNALEKTIVNENLSSSDGSDNYARFRPSEIYGIKKSDGTILYEDDAYIENSMLLEDSEGKVYLKVASNETIIFIFYANWSAAAEKQDSYSVSELNVQFDFSQIKSGMTTSTNGTSCLYGC